ncbi:recombination protein NinG [Pseudomonas amygdali]|uniref:Protein ninG n=1 Tax=Pseudomonas phage phiPSA1 TaxID=1500757 RepID=A0A059VA66_9CAUD|nr:MULTISPECIES: recombination protein NinG [Pseudomonas syringae group]YP_009043588.1 NinG/ Rap DNA junction specific endonuclease [Pseudomonas phage phiPSA1]QXV71633.1 putative recombination protein [Pseudomonas phage psageB2]AHZ95073.1 NinG [Pseudomonas phage phiPSA1]MBI6727698.1 recombination protein NinG [Pseudomonas amygdali]MBI6810737.1 recombination protein NinG [Pseudomonas amygdali]MDG6439122.1 recombination protein NinG [Pseudomonas syringae pv. actinidiae]
MSLAIKERKKKTCANSACAIQFVPAQLGQKVCGWACGLAIAPANQERARKAIAQRDRQEIKVRKEKLKSRSDHMRDTQQAFNEWVRHRDAALPCVSCGRHHQGKYDAGHYRTVGSNPALRFEPLNCHKQCVPCNQHKSGNVVEYRIELVRRIGIVNVEWLEGPHEPQKYTVEELKALTAKYRAMTKELKKGQAA